MPEAGQGVDHMVLVVHVEGVGEVLWLAVDIGPQGHRLTLHLLREGGRG